MKIKHFTFGLAALALAGCVAKPSNNVDALPSADPAPRQVASAAAPVPAQIAVTPKQRVRFIQESQFKGRIDEFYPKTGKSTKANLKLNGGRQRVAGDISLQFQDTNLREVVRAILGDILKRNFVIDPNVSGKVTLTTDRALQKSELVPTLEAILATQGAKLIDFGGVYRITKSNDPATLAGGGIGVGAESIRGTGNLRVFPLAFIAAKDMAGILKPLLPKGAIVNTDAKRNILMIAGSGQQLRLVADSVKIFDVDQMVDKNVLMISMDHADAKAIAAELRAIFGADARTGGPDRQVQFMVVERLNAILITSSHRNFIDKAREWVFRLDRARSPTERRLFVYYVQNGQASKLADSIRGIVGGLTADAPVKAAANETKPAATIPGTPSPRSTPGTTPDITPSPTLLVAARNTTLGDGVNVSVDAEHNALLISATPKDFAIVDELLAKLDIQPLQVNIEVTIFEVRLNDALRFGIQYAISNGGLGITRDGTAALTRGTTTGISAGNIITPIISPLVPGFSFSIDGSSRTRFIIDTLSSITEVNIISSPNILVLNNHTAELQVGDEVPVVTQSTTSTVTDSPLIINTVQYRNTGVSLAVTPHVNASGMVTLEIAQNVSNVLTTTTSNIDSPTIQNRSILSTVLVKSGETVMLGGLIREESTTASSGIPILHDLPVIGALFGQKSNNTNRTELVILIRPVVSASPDDTRNISEDMRRKFQILLQNQKIGIRQPRRPSSLNDS